MTFVRVPDPCQGTTKKRCRTSKICLTVLLCPHALREFPLVEHTCVHIFFCIGCGNGRVPTLSCTFLEHLSFTMPPEAPSVVHLTATERTFEVHQDTNVRQHAKRLRLQSPTAAASFSPAFSKGIDISAVLRGMNRELRRDKQLGNF